MIGLVLVNWDREKLKGDIKNFPQVKQIDDSMSSIRDGVARMIMLERYAFKDVALDTLGVGDLAIVIVKNDPNYPIKGIGVVQEVRKNTVLVHLEEQYQASIPDEEEAKTGIVERSKSEVNKPLEVYYEQIADRVSRGLSEVEEDDNVRDAFQKELEFRLRDEQIVPAGRVLFGAGSGQDVTYFNCYVMPAMEDSREGISKHRSEAIEIMSRGGGVGTNGSSLRPRNSLAKGVNGKSSGSVSWLNDLAELTHLVEQGGSRRGAQMLMMADWHPDVLEFIISKMQNPDILRHIINTFDDEYLKDLAKDKLKFTPLKQNERETYEKIVKYDDLFSEETVKDAKRKLKDGGTYDVHNPDFLSGANISVTITDEFMEAVENGDKWTFKFPDVNNYNKQQMEEYNDKWHDYADYREWEELGYPIAEYGSIDAKEMWKLINVCATYSAEPGIFFIDRANADTNATAYGQKVIATNPCGEQPLAPYSVCNLSAINLSQMVNKDTKEVDYDKLREAVRVNIRMQDNIIDSTPYFLEANTKQALGERRIGMGVMGLADMLIYTETVYGSESGNELVAKVFETMATTAYEHSIELAKEKGSFPFLIGATDEETQELREKFITTGFVKKLPQHIKDGILEHGIRNSHLLTVAPTGSTGSMINVSTGLEPYFAFKYYRSGRLGQFMEVNSPIVQEYLDNNPTADENNLPDFFVSAMDLSPEAHVDVQNTIQYWVDSSISKTVNAPKGYKVSQVQSVYERLFSGGAKGGTVYVDGSRDTQVLTLENDDEKEDVKPLVVDDRDELVRFVEEAKSEHNKTKGHTDDVVYGSEIGDTCPVCRMGVVEDIGGCNTCNNCQAQLKCGL